MLKTKNFYFIRHGETDHNKYNIADESHDIPLNQTGIDQAHAIRDTIHKLQIKSVCYSPYQRAVHTKEIIFQDLDVEHIEIPELSECTPEQWADMVEAKELSAPHVEDFMKRSIHGINKALEQEGPVLVVAHGGIHYAFCHHMQVEHEWIIGNCIPIHFTYSQGWNAQLL